MAGSRGSAPGALRATPRLSVRRSPDEWVPFPGPSPGSGSNSHWLVCGTNVGTLNPTWDTGQTWTKPRQIGPFCFTIPVAARRRGVAVSILACQARGRGFKSRRLRQVKRGDRSRSPLCLCTDRLCRFEGGSVRNVPSQFIEPDGGRGVAGRTPIAAGRQGAPRTHLGTVGYGRALELRNLKEPEQEHI